jgi:hypothetical protein
MLAEQLTTLDYLCLSSTTARPPLAGRPTASSPGRIAHPATDSGYPWCMRVSPADLSYLIRHCAPGFSKTRVRIRANVETGLPHWVFTEDRPGGQWLVDDAPGGPGRCMLVERPSELPDETRADTDAGLILAKPRPDAALVGLAATISGLPSSTIRSLLTGEGARVLVVSPVGDRRATSVSIAHASRTRVWTCRFRMRDEMQAVSSRPHGGA